MVGLFAQMWALEVVAFLLGAAVTWLVFVRPARAAAVRPPEQPAPLPPAWASAPPADQLPAPREPEPPAPTADPALAELDAHARHARRSAFSAADVLEQLSNTSPLPVIDGKKR